MNQETVYSLLAAAAYDDARLLRVNKTPIPPGWLELPEFQRSNSGPSATWNGSGFSARVFQGPNGQIVIAYAGTEARFREAGGITDFVSGNVLALGLYGEQGYQAALLYQKVKERFGASADITFTGHSLGGGLAGLMAVWFDRPAVVFDPAPFEASTYNFSDALFVTRAKLSWAGYPDSAFRNYDRATHFAQRESRVASYAIAGEVLETIPRLQRIEYNRMSYLQGAAPDLSPTAKHSIDLLSALMMLDGFKQAAAELRELLPVLLDQGLCGSDVLGAQPDLLMRLIRNEVGIFDPLTGAQSTAPNGLLTKFTADVRHLAQVDMGAAQSQLRAALVAAATDYYALRDPAAASALFTAAGNAVHFKYSDIGAGQYKSLPMLVDAVQALAGQNTINASGSRLIHQDAWHVQSGQAGITWTAAGTDNDNDAVIGGAQSDTVDAGADTLDGGANADWLAGGAGLDSYEFSGSWGRDLIEDGDGGSLNVEGFAGGLPAGYRDGPGAYPNASRSGTVQFQGAMTCAD